MCRERTGWPRQLVLLSGLVASACGESALTDMWYQPAIAAGQAPRAAPESSLALGSGAWPRDREHAKGLANPTEGGPARLARGRSVYVGRCVACHGAMGHGDGPVARFFPPMSDLAPATMKGRSDGDILGTLLFGGRTMPPMGAGLTLDDLWAVVALVQDLPRGRGRPSR